MKRLLVALPLCFATVAAVAATSATLSVTGQILPPSCDIAVSGTGQFDFGEVMLNPTGATNVNPRLSQTLSINCDNPSYTGFTVTDNHASSVPASVSNAQRFGLGTDSANNPIGFYNILFQNIVADAGTGLIKSSVNTSAATWADASTAFIDAYALSLKTYAFDSATTPTTAPRAVTNASVGLDLGVQIQPRNTLDTNSDIVLDGSATIELIYL
ncbi:DUF1120 domain-containing protein [Pseudomonas sp. NPDC086251]|uniref:DUF1120 domain-containing protein n=1 Tax=Pseudomonas sp. NPDC086251 TaxID=3364431 RepID=UPI00383605B5